jgi:hypothetical protein
MKMLCPFCLAKRKDASDIGIASLGNDEPRSWDKV